MKCRASGKPPGQNKKGDAMEQGFDEWAKQELSKAHAYVRALELLRADYMNIPITVRPTHDGQYFTEAEMFRVSLVGK